MTSRANPSDFTLRLASPAQEEEYWRATFVPWARGKDWETFKKGNVESKAGPWAEDGGVKAWVLVKRDDLDGTVYAGCETHRRKSLQKSPQTHEVREVFSYGIASVVTPVAHHRNGYATHMLRLLHFYISEPSTLPPFPTAEWGAAPPPLDQETRRQLPPAIASILFSDVGSTFYEKATIGIERPGWIVRDDQVQQITWKLFSPQSDRPKRNWIYAQDVPAIRKQLSAASRQHLAQFDKSTASVWAPDPATVGTLSYITAMTMGSRPADWPYTAETEPCGIRIHASKAGQDEAIVLFTGSHKTPLGTAVLVTLIEGLDAERLPELLGAIDEVGTRMGLKEGLVWGLTPGSPLGQAWAKLEESRKVEARRRDERGGHLLGIAWYGGEERGTMVDTQMWSWC